MTMHCYLCHRGPNTGHALFRINPKGEAGIWACETHRPPNHVVPAEVRYIEAALSPDEDEADDETEAP
jgi:hypothetical protein